MDSVIDIKVANIGYSIQQKNNILLNLNKIELGNIYLKKNRTNLVSPIYQGAPSTHDIIQIGGARENGTRIIVDGPPIKRTFWYRFKRSFRRIFF